MTTITQVITTLPTAPARSQAPATFIANADAHVASLTTLVSEINTWRGQANMLATGLNAIATGAALAIPLTFSTTTTDSDPGNGILRLDNATQNTATTIRTDLIGNDGSTWTDVINLFDDSTSTIKGFITLVDTTDATKWLVFSVSAVASPSGYKNISVACVASSAANPFANGASLALKFTRTGDKGDTGSGFTGGSMTSAINVSRATVASHATTADIWAAAGNQIDWTGTATTTAFPNAPQAGAERVLICAGACSFTAGANMLIDGVASASTVTCAAGDSVIVRAVSTTQFKLSRVKYDGTAQVSAGGGSWVYLSTVTASASATVDIETTFDATYDNYVIVASNILPATNNDSLYLRMKIGGTYATTGYYYHISQLAGDSTLYAGIADQGVAQVILGATWDSTSTKDSHIFLYIANAAATGKDKGISVHGQYSAGTGVKTLQGMCNYLLAGALTGIRFYFSTGNIASGTFRLYGIKNS